MLKCRARYPGLLNCVLLVAGVFAASRGLLPSPGPSLSVYLAGIPTAWLMLLGFRALDSSNRAFLRSVETRAFLAVAGSSAVWLAAQVAIDRTLWWIPTVVNLGAVLLIALIFPGFIHRSPTTGKIDHAAAWSWLELAVLNLVLWPASLLQENAPVAGGYVGLIVATWFCFTRFLPVPAAGNGRRIRHLAHILAIHLGAFLVAAGAAGAFGTRQILTNLPGLFVVSLAGVLGFRVIRDRLERFDPHPLAEATRRVGLLFASWVLLQPLLTYRAVGGGDAVWYATMLRDAVEQFRAGQFPLYLGQSPFAFHGGVFPFMLAPYFLYLGGLVDLLTCHTLEVFAVQHLTAALSLTAGMLVMYGCVKKLAPSHPWPAMGVALLYGGSPGVLAPLYTSDMYLTVMALPWIPLAIYCAVRAAITNDRLDWLGLGASVGILCWVHIPLAVWTGGACALSLLGRLVLGSNRRQTLLGTGISLLVFGLVSVGYFLPIFTSVHAGATHPPNLNAILDNLARAMPAALLPASATTAHISDFQLGYSLWLLLAAGLVFAASSRVGVRNSGWIFSAVLLVVLVLPVPFLTRGIWGVLPDQFVAANDLWPMQRIYLVLSAIACLIGGTAIARLEFTLGLALFRYGFAVLLIWSCMESGKFVVHGRKIISWNAASMATALELNHRLTTNSFHPYYPERPLPHYFSHAGTVDPALALRLLKRADHLPLPQEEQKPAPLTRQIHDLRAEPHSLWPFIVGLRPTLTLPPHSRWLARFRFPPRNFQGRFHLDGHWINRQYLVPMAAEPARPDMLTKTMVLWNDHDQPDTVILRYYPDPNTPLPELTSPEHPPSDQTKFAQLELTPFQPDTLPIVIQSFIPLRLRVDAPEAAFVETFRLWVPGYKAWVNGKPTTPEMSGDSLIMLPVPSGRSIVELKYEGVWYIRLSTWISFFTFVVLGATCAGRVRLGRRAVPTPP